MWRKNHKNSNAGTSKSSSSGKSKSSSKSKSKSSTTKKKSNYDPYDVDKYNSAQEFADDKYEEFYDYEDDFDDEDEAYDAAEDYWNEHHWELVIKYMTNAKSVPWHRWNVSHPSCGRS